MNLRPYQTDALRAAAAKLANHRSTLIVMATGLGKTVSFAHLAKQFLASGRVIVLAHREELIWQARKTLEIVTEKRVGVEMAESSCHWPLPPIVVSTVQTMSRQHRHQKYDPNEVSLVIVDEGHHAVAAQWRKCIDWFGQNPACKTLFVTATPKRHDGIGLKNVCESVAYEYGIKDAIQDGWLVRILKARPIHVTGLDLSTVKTVAGDLNKSELARILEYERNVHEMASPLIHETEGRRTLGFAASVAQAEMISEVLNRHELGCSCVVHGKTPKEERREILRAYDNDEFRFLWNVGVATEGFDSPGIGCIAMARPTKSIGLFTQMLGRGTRPLPGVVDGLGDSSTQRREAIATSGKPNLLVIEFTGNSGRHKLVRVEDALAGRVVSDQPKRRQERDEPEDVLDLLAEETDLAAAAEEQARKEAIEEARKLGIKAKSFWTKSEVDLFNVLDIQSHQDLPGLMPIPASHKQIAVLEKCGFKNASQLSMHEAGPLVDSIMQRKQQGLCSPKQASFLRKYGIDAKGLKGNEATSLILEIKWNQYRPTQQIYARLNSGNLQRVQQ